MTTPAEPIKWPNQHPVVDGVEPMAETSQDSNWVPEDADPDRELED